MKIWPISVFYKVSKKSRLLANSPVKMYQYSIIILLKTSSISIYVLEILTKFHLNILSLHQNLNYELDMQIKSGFAINMTHTNNEMCKNEHTWSSKLFIKTVLKIVMNVLFHHDITKDTLFIKKYFQNRKYLPLIYITKKLVYYLGTPSIYWIILNVRFPWRLNIVHAFLGGICNW